jgi:2-oxoglutarate ferredoxin oxidoreductase subunit beta
MLFGKNNEKGLILDGLKLKVVTLGENGITEDDIIVHDALEPNPGIQYMLANMKYPEYPVALGIIRAVQAETYNDAIVNQINAVKKASKIKCMDDLLMSGSTWVVD